MSAPDRPEEPDVVIVGAGTFGAVLAWWLSRDPDGPRVLLLDAGEFERAEHVQSPPVANLSVPPPVRRLPGSASSSLDGVWEVPWRCDFPSHGLAYCVGGRSLYWGAACVWPRLDRTSSRDAWPARVAKELGTVTCLRQPTSLA